MNQVTEMKVQDLVNTVKTLTVGLDLFLKDEDFYEAQNTLSDIEYCIRSIRSYIHERF